MVKKVFFLAVDSIFWFLELWKLKSKIILYVNKITHILNQALANIQINLIR